MKLLMSVIIVFFFSKAQSQHNYKPVEEIAYNTSIKHLDTTKFYITKIDTVAFRSILNENKKIAIQLWQPWCSGIIELIPKINALKQKLDEGSFLFLFISDNEHGAAYYRITEKKIGKIIYFYNRYNIRFNTYIIDKNEKLDHYKRIIKEVTQTKINYNFFCFLLNGKELIYQNYSYPFYKKILKD